MKKSFTGLLLIPQGTQMKNWSQWWNFDTSNIAHFPSPFALSAKKKQKMLSWPRPFHCSLVKPIKKLSKVRDWLTQIGSKASSTREVLDQDCPKVPRSSLQTRLLYLFVFVLLLSHLFLIIKQIMKGEGCLVCGNRGRQSKNSVQGEQGAWSFFHHLHFEFLMKMKKKRFSFRYKSMSCFQMTLAL